jgi:hypothetical protein
MGSLYNVVTFHSAIFVHVYPRWGSIRRENFLINYIFEKNMPLKKRLNCNQLSLKTKIISMKFLLNTWELFESEMHQFDIKRNALWIFCTQALKNIIFSMEINPFCQMRWNWIFCLRKVTLNYPEQ